jgi:hypothetical protein
MRIISREQSIGKSKTEKQKLTKEIQNKQEKQSKELKRTTQTKKKTIKSWS